MQKHPVGESDKNQCGSGSTKSLPYMIPRTINRDTTFFNLQYGYPVAMSNNDLSRSEAYVLLLSFQKRSNVNVSESKFWIETKSFLSVLKNFRPKTLVLFPFPKVFQYN